MRIYMRTIVVATNNLGKIKEFQKLFSEDKVLSLKDIGYTKEIIENGKTFQENAYIKAKEVAKSRNAIVLADDSGLEVEALNGAPGIYSARYAGDHDTEKNNALLIKNLKGIENRKARFVCALCLYYPDDTYILVEGECFGQITEEARGSNGFGYDPYFFIPEYSKTMAELPLETKNQISHRANALKKLKELL